MTVPTPELDLSAGAYVKGIRLSETTFMAVTAFQQLRTLTRDPAVLQPGSKRGNDDPGIEDERAIHELIQRALAGNKKSNVPRYTRYIEELVREERIGVLPPIHLWSPEGLQVVSNGNLTYILVPNGEHLLAIDGETQLSAHHALSRSQADSETRAKHQKFPLGALIHHGVPVKDARQYFHDLNILAVRPNTSLGLAMDAQDPLMEVVSNVEVNIDLLVGNVEKMTRQLSKNSEKILTLQSLRQMVIDVAKGIAGVQYGARPVPVQDLDLREVTQVAVEWIGAYLSQFEAEVRDREHYLAGTGPVLAAVGAMGNDLLGLDADQRALAIPQMLDSLFKVDWTKDAQWSNIAGDFTSRGAFSVKGTKEVAYAVYAALHDQHSAGYHKIRPARLPLDNAPRATAIW